MTAPAYAGTRPGNGRLSTIPQIANATNLVAADRCAGYPQVNPPVPHDGPPDGESLRPAKLKVDILLRAPLLPHLGHSTSSSHSPCPLSLSKHSPHAPHSYSYKGISQNLPAFSPVFFSLPPSGHKYHTGVEIRRSHPGYCTSHPPVQQSDHIFYTASHDSLQNLSPLFTLIVCVPRPILGLTAGRQSGFDPESGKHKRIQRKPDRHNHQYYNQSLHREPPFNAVTIPATRGSFTEYQTVAPFRWAATIPLLLRMARCWDTVA